MVSGVLEHLSPLSLIPAPYFGHRDFSLAPHTHYDPPQCLCMCVSYSLVVLPHSLFLSPSPVTPMRGYLSEELFHVRGFILCCEKCFLLMEKQKESKYPLLFSTKFYTKICNSLFQKREWNACRISCSKTLFCVCFCLELIIACLFILLGKWEKFVAGHSGLDRRIRLSPQVRHFFLSFLDVCNLKIFYSGI